MVTNGGNPLGRLGGEDSEEVEDGNGLRQVELTLKHFTKGSDPQVLHVLYTIQPVLPQFVWIIMT